jgi:hypothetical protein
MDPDPGPAKVRIGSGSAKLLARLFFLVFSVVREYTGCGSTEYRGYSAEVLRSTEYTVLSKLPSCPD